MEKVNDQEYRFPESWKLEPWKVDESAEYTQIEGPIPVIYNIYHEFCKYDEEPLKRNTSDNVVMKSEIVADWRTGRNVEIIIKNEKYEPICGARFTIGVDATVGV